MFRKIFLSLVSIAIFSSAVLAQNKKKEEVPLTLSLLEKCLHMGIDTVETMLAPTGFSEKKPTDKQLEELKDKWKPNRTLLMAKGNVEIVIVFSNAGVFHFTVRSESTKDKTGDNLFLEALKAQYKEVTHDGEN